ncbi:sugar/nucleoside kinase (ribokinase family) [Rhizobium sp. PP-F2F-G20b]|nr:sugar/nucleoside kinase (ribokinase family) [Rhizobium sp. PP-F2F-G20b]
MAPHRLDVLGFGAVAIDDIVYVDRPLKAGKGKVVGRTRDFGGNVATALVAVAKLGGQAGFIGWLGSTPDEDPSAGELERQGVDVSRAPRRPDARAIRSVITVGPDGDRFIAYDDDVPHGTCHDLSDETLSEASVLLVDGYATHSERTVARARALGLSVVADIEWSIGTATDRLIALADHLVLPLAYAEAQTGETAPASILQRLWADDRAVVVLTDGDRGAFVRQAGAAGNWHVPAYAVRAVDTTGAGDCFHGAYALALARGEPPIDCVRYAAAAAAISVTGKGGRMALPDHAACTALMQAAGAPRPLAMS